MKKIFIDVETTGVNPRMNGIWQVSGCVEIPGQDLKWFNFILNPPESLSHWDDRAKELFEQQAKHKQYNLEKDGLTYPVFHKMFTNEILAAVDRYNKHDKFFFIGYNSSFDDAMMRALFDYCGDCYYGSFFAWPSIDVAVLAAERLGDELLKMPNVKLNSMAARLGITVDQSKLHDAQYDIELTRDMYHIITARDIWAGGKPATEEVLKKIVGSLPDFPDISDNRRWKHESEISALPLVIDIQKAKRTIAKISHPCGWCGELLKPRVCIIKTDNHFFHPECWKRVKECFPGGFVYGGMVRGEHKVRPECIKKNKEG